jgi:hypothetical protein
MRLYIYLLNIPSINLNISHCRYCIFPGFWVYSEGKSIVKGGEARPAIASGIFLVWRWMGDAEGESVYGAADDRQAHAPGP